MPIETQEKPKTTKILNYLFIFGSSSFIFRELHDNIVLIAMLCSWECCIHARDYSNSREQLNDLNLY